MHSSSPVLIEGHIQLIVAERVLGDTFVRFVERSRRKHSRFVEISHGEHSQFVVRCQFEIPGVEPMFCWIGEKLSNMFDAIFLDRDGTISHDPYGYINSLSDYKFFDYTFEALEILNKHTDKFVIVTNQSGLSSGRGK